MLPYLFVGEPVTSYQVLLNSRAFIEQEVVERSADYVKAESELSQAYDKFSEDSWEGGHAIELAELAFEHAEVRFEHANLKQAWEEQHYASNFAK